MFVLKQCPFKLYVYERKLFIVGVVGILSFFYENRFSKVTLMNMNSFILWIVTIMT